MSNRSRLLAAGAIIAAGGLFYWRDALTLHSYSVDAAIAAPAIPDFAGADPEVRAAIESATGAVRQNPQSAAAWGRLGMLLRAHDFRSEANTCFGQAERLDPKEPRWPYYYGIGLVQGQPENALPKLERAAALFGDQKDAPRLRLGELLLDQGRLNQAAQTFERVLKYFPDNARARLDLARVHRASGEFQQASELLGPLVNDARTRKSAASLMAEVERRIGNSAADDFLAKAQAMPADPLWPDPAEEEIRSLRLGLQVRLARLDRLLSQGRTVEAATGLEELVRRYPESDWAWLLLGRARLAREEHAPAEEALRRAVELAGDSIEGWYYLGVARMSQNNNREAVASFKRALEIKPDFAEAQYSLGLALQKLGDRAGAIQAMRASLESKPHNAEVHRDLGELLVKAGQKADAERHLRLALELDSSDERAKTGLHRLAK